MGKLQGAKHYLPSGKCKTTMRYHLTSVGAVIIWKTRDKCWRGCGEKETLVHYSENASWNSQYGKQ